jgi:hypothetical protein
MDTRTTTQLIRRLLRTDLHPRQRRALEEAVKFLEQNNIDRAAEMIRGVLDTRLTDTQERVLNHVNVMLNDQHTEWFERALKEDPEFRAFYEDRRRM